MTMKMMKYGVILPHEIITLLKSTKPSLINCAFIKGIRNMATHTSVYSIFSPILKFLIVFILCKCSD